MHDHLPLFYPKVTIVTPSLNQGQFIDDTIRSVLKQDYPNLEYIIMDGGSTDNTLDILRTYSDRLTWTSETDQGQSHAINKGLQMARGEIVAYLNADDLLLPGALEKVVQAFRRDPSLMWVTGKCRIVNESGQEIRKLITLYKNLLLRLHSRSLLLITDYISQPATFWKAEVFRNCGPFDQNLHYAMDYEYWLRIVEKHPLGIIPAYLAAFRVHPQSKNSRAGHRDVYVDEERSVIEKFTQSKSLLGMHDLHRWLMTTVYSLTNSS